MDEPEPWVVPWVPVVPVLAAPTVEQVRQVMQSRDVVVLLPADMVEGSIEGRPMEGS